MYAVDANGDGKVDEGDAKWLADLLKFTQLDDKLRLEAILRADLTGDKLVTQADVDKLNQIIAQPQDFALLLRHQADLVRDDVLDSKDLSYLQDLARVLKGDMTGNLLVNILDVDAMLTKMTDYNALLQQKSDMEAVPGFDANSQAYKDLTARVDALKTLLNLNGDDQVNALDVDFLNLLVKEFKPLVKIHHYADLNKDGLVSVAERDSVVSTIQHYVDIDGDGKVDQKDIDKLNNVLIYKRLNVSDEELARARMDADTDVDEDDMKLLQDAVKWFKVADVDGNGVVEDKDVKRIEDIYNFILSNPTLEIPYDEIKAADLNLDGTVDARDIDVITDYRAGKFDINGDGRWTEEDAIRMGEVVQYFNLHITALDRFKADLNGNKEIDEGDINTLSQLVPVFTSGDLNGNGFVDDDDLDKVQRMVDFLRFDLPAPKVIEGWDLDNDGKMDTTFVQNPLYRADVNHDGVITLEDKQIVQTLLNQMIDINGDQVFDQDDASRILEVMESANLLVTDEDVLTADMDGDGRISACSMIISSFSTVRM